MTGRKPNYNSDKYRLQIITNKTSPEHRARRRQKIVGKKCDSF